MSLTTPRSLRLPNYLQSAPAWTDMANAIDVVFQLNLDDPIKQLADALSQTQYHPTNVELKTGNALLDETDWIYDGERWISDDIRVKIVSLLGFTYLNTGLFTNDAVELLARNGAQFLPFQGKPEFIEFIGFFLGQQITLSNLWTVDYINFFDESIVNNPIYNSGGNQYPTTTVDVNVNMNNSLPVEYSLFINVLLFYFPINLVIRYINFYYTDTGHLDIGGYGSMDVIWDVPLPNPNDTIIAFGGFGSINIIWL